MPTHKNRMFQSALIELQSDCNRECFFCPRSSDASGRRLNHDGSHARHRMSTGMAVGLINEIVEMGFQGPIGFHHLSEPFLDPRILSMAHYAKDKGLKPYVHTNGDILRRSEELQKLAADVLDKIVIGVYDVFDPDEVESEKAFWQQIFPDVQIGFSCANHVFPRTLTAYDPRMFRSKEITHGPCRRPHLRLIIHYNGAMAFCCEDMNESFDLGNVKHSSISDLWHSEHRRKILEDLDKGIREPYDLCRQSVLPAHRP